MGGEASEEEVEKKVGLPLLVTAISPESWSPLAKKQPAFLFIRSSSATVKTRVPAGFRRSTNSNRGGNRVRAKGREESGSNRSDGRREQHSQRRANDERSPRHNHAASRARRPEL